MKCINKKLLCALCAISILFTGCGAQSKIYSNEYEAYSYKNSYLNQEGNFSADYYAKDLCVSNAINFGEETYSYVAQ